MCFGKEEKRRNEEKRRGWRLYLSGKRSHARELGEKRGSENQRDEMHGEKWRGVEKNRGVSNVGSVALRSAVRERFLETRHRRRNHRAGGKTISASRHEEATGR